jgi:hypothetical protein
MIRALDPAAPGHLLSSRPAAATRCARVIDLSHDAADWAKLLLCHPQTKTSAGWNIKINAGNEHADRLRMIF